MDNQLNGTAVGIDLVGGLALRASRAKLVVLLPALCWALRLDVMAPISMQRLLGHIDWFNLLCRPLFSVLAAAYAFARRVPAAVPLDLPRRARFALRWPWLWLWLLNGLSS